jgi:hypothetical protein
MVRDCLKEIIRFQVLVSSQLLCHTFLKLNKRYICFIFISVLGGGGSDTSSQQTTRVCVNSSTRLYILTVDAVTTPLV